MRTFQECIPCMGRQVRAAARTASTDITIRAGILREAMAAVCALDPADSPPVMGQRIHRIVRRISGNPDPYRDIKARFNALALGMLPALRQKVEDADDPMEAAVRLAIAGNIIDCGPNHDLQEADVHAAVAEASVAPLLGDVEQLRNDIVAANRILYLADNAGEIVFDRLLIERLPADKVTVAVRRGPVINDATMQDARVAGLTDLVEVIDNGSDAPGTILADCSDAFRERFLEADLVMAKGQGNYETLCDGERDVAFLLKVKCPVIARHIGCDVGSLVVSDGRSVAVDGEGGGVHAGT